MPTSDAQALAARLVHAISTLEPQGLAALENSILLLENGQDLRRSKGGHDLGVGTYVDSGDMAFMMVCVGLVQLMTIPGLALFYGGLSQAPNVLATVMQSFSITCLVTILWLICGYSIAFDRSVNSNPVVGGSGMLWFNSTAIMDAEIGTIPLSLYVTYQGTFAVITAAIITGSVAERMRFGPAKSSKVKMLIFLGIWHLLVYCPLCHWEWGGGFMSEWGVLDFAGGDVVHISSGVSGLAASFVVGKRKGFASGQEMPPHNLLLFFMGASLLWVGWFGFNAGSALAANQSASMALMVTHISGCAGGLSWMLLEWALKGRPSMMGTVSGAVAGLVVVTPGSGFMDQTGGFVAGITGAPVCYFGIQLKHQLGYDDALDAFGVHGIGGIWGGLVTGLLANPAVGGPDATGAFFGNPKQLGIQIAGILTSAVYSFAMTLIILVPLHWLLKATTGTGVRVSEESEHVGLDISEHGESMMAHVYYNANPIKASSADSLPPLFSSNSARLRLPSPRGGAEWGVSRSDMSAVHDTNKVVPFDDSKEIALVTSSGTSKPATPASLQMRENAHNDSREITQLVEEIELISTNTEVGTVLRRKRDASDEAMNFTDLDR